MIRILLSTRLGERRMTQSDLARVTGIRSQTINELYHDFAERVNLDDLDLICEALDCDLEDLIVREPNIERLEIFGQQDYIKTSKPESMSGKEIYRWVAWERQNMK